MACTAVSARLGGPTLWTAAILLVASPPRAGAEDTLDCIIEAQQIVDLASPAVGVIAELLVDRGDAVRAGQYLGKLEDGVESAGLALARARATSQAAVRSAEAELRLAESERLRAAELNAKRIASKADLERAEATADVARQRVEEAKSDLEIAGLEVRRAEALLARRRIESPIDGIVIERLLLAGEYRDEQSAILRIAEVDPLRVEVFVPTAYYGRLAPGQGATVLPEAPIGGQHEATIDVVDEVLDAASGTFGVRLRLANRGRLLPAGVRCSVRFEEAVREREKTLGEAGD